MKPLLMVDGYNVIGAWREAKEKRYSLDESRDRLFHLLQDYAGFTGEAVVLVFDGHHSERKLRSSETYKDATVIYTKQGETADSYIERSVSLEPKYRIIRVATNDGLEQSQILSTGATRLTAGELLRELTQIRKREAEKREVAKSLQRTPLAQHLTDEQRDVLEKMRRGQ